MFEEEFEELKFDGNRGRDVFIKEILDIEPIIHRNFNYILDWLDDI